MSSIFQLTKGVERKPSPVFKILLNNYTGFSQWLYKRVESNFKVLFSCQAVKDFSCFCLDVESLVTYLNNKMADF